MSGVQRMTNEDVILAAKGVKVARRALDRAAEDGDEPRRLLRLKKYNEAVNMLIEVIREWDHAARLQPGA